MSVMVVSSEPAGADAVADDRAADSHRGHEAARRRASSTGSRRMSGSSEVGLHGQQRAVVERDGGHGLGELVAHARGWSRAARSSSSSGYRKPVVRTPSGGPPTASSEHRSPGAPESRASRRMTVMRASPSSASMSRSANDGGREQQRVRRGGGRAGRRSRRRRSRRRAAGSRGVARASSRSVWSLSVGYRSHLGAIGHGGVDGGRIGGVEVADDEVDVPTEGERVLDARVGRDGRSPSSGSRAAIAASTGSPPANTSATLAGGRLHHPSLRRNYPVQVPRVGGAATRSAWPPSQPGCPELPIGSNPIVS